MLKTLKDLYNEDTCLSDREIAEPDVNYALRNLDRAHGTRNAGEIVHARATYLEAREQEREIRVKENNKQKSLQADAMEEELNRSTREKHSKK